MATLSITTKLGLLLLSVAFLPGASQQSSYGSPRPASFQYTVGEPTYFHEQEPQILSLSQSSPTDGSFFKQEDGFTSEGLVSSQRPSVQSGFISSTPQPPADVTIIPSGRFFSTQTPNIENSPSGFISTQGTPIERGFGSIGYGPSEDGFNAERGFDASLIEDVRRGGRRPKTYKSSPGRRPYSGRALYGPTNVPYLLEDNEFLQQTPNIPGYGPNSFGSLNGFRGGQCGPRPQCRPTKYRNVDGTCNNLRNPQWGATGTPYGRLLPPRYSDGVHAPPVSVASGDPLPGARQLSRLNMPPAQKDDPIWTLVSMQWGQYITHDMSLAMDTLPNPRAPECCDPIRGPLFGKLSKGEPCYPIGIEDDDTMYLKYQQTCMEFLRTTTDLQRGCPFSGHAKPLSAASHWLDGSTVYGSDEPTQRSLRAGQGGRLLVEVRNGQEWPPTNYNDSVTCGSIPPQQACYKTGDVRVNQNPQLALLEITLMREHNRIADSLKKINPHWSDETLFQEAKRIVIAEIQHISYYEWLPIFLGRDTVEEGLNYPSGGAYVNDYDEKVDPSVLNEHAQGAFRFFHTLIQGHLLLMSERRYSQGHIRLVEHMNDPTILEADGVYDALVRGFTTQLEHAADRFHAQDVVENLFRRPQNPAFGFDLKSLDIHRDRDHGLASYNSYREYCGHGRASTFRDFEDLIKPQIVRSLETVYQHPDDVDLSVGGTVENLAPGALVGPTFLCILREQFYRSRVADRFFYENGDQAGSFTPEQLTELRRSSMARMLCDNSEEVYTMQPRAFEKLSKTNPLVSCADFEAIPIVNLEYWRDNARRPRKLPRFN